MSGVLDDPFAELNAVLKTGRKLVHESKAARAKHAAETPAETDNQLYANPDNWIKGRGIALIHAESQTLLGNFVEYTHRKVPDARRLVREDSPLAVSATEVVSGSWWLGEGRKPQPVQAWHEKRMVTLHLHLGELGLHSPAVQLHVYLEYGGIARAELAAETTFAQTEGEEQLVTLPAGTNILPCLTRDCKVRLRLEVGL